MGKRKGAKCRLFSEESRAQYQGFRLDISERRTSAANDAKTIAANPLWAATAFSNKEATGMTITVDLLACIMNGPSSVQ